MKRFHSRQPHWILHVVCRRHSDQPSASLEVCNPRRNTLLKEGSKSVKVDARKLAELLRAGLLRAVYGD
jgi:hypothetical protein